MVSIICPIYNEERFINQCIDSMLAQDFPPKNWELLLVDGGSTDRTQERIEPYLKHVNIHLLNNPYRTAPYAMNIGIRAAKGEYICRIDAHSSFPPNYVSTLFHYINELPDAANVGVACITKPRNNSPKARAIAAVLSNKYGVGNSSFRLGINEVTETDTVPFGFYKKESFDEIGYYDERLTRNQDIELNKRIAAHGGKIYLVPDITCTYYARATYRKLAQNNFANGKWNILTVFYTRNFSSLGLRHFIPLLFVLSIITGFPIIIYYVAIGIVSWKLAKKSDLSFFHLLWAFTVLHVSYGLGSLIGILQLPFLKRL